jgi:hypothetical protein
MPGLLGGPSPFVAQHGGGARGQRLARLDRRLHGQPERGGDQPVGGGQMGEQVVHGQLAVRGDPVPVLGREVRQQHVQRRDLGGVRCRVRGRGGRRPSPRPRGRAQPRERPGRRPEVRAAEVGGGLP